MSTDASIDILRQAKLKTYEQARRYWQEVGDTERLALTDAELDEQFWVIDHEDIPRLKVDQAHVTLPYDPLEAILGAFDDDITDLSTSVRQMRKQRFGGTDDRLD